MDYDGIHLSCSNPDVARQSDKTSSVYIMLKEWNKLPQVVIEATSVNVFKNRLDRHWSDMGVYS